ncbi:hypothetical protein [Phytoactinopolyspora limicola]|uniref:hypothetical protein n=1 Tax=Phytoactinopolyspora limicola TaxID=2715536 RepID=UPI00140BC185|nr:hypothetical protein [Phytoactinopolyspora limicola]
MTGWDTRAQVGLRAPLGIRTDVNPTAGVGGHHGGTGPFRRERHEDCRAIARAWQAWHMDPRNPNRYNDVAYNLFACHHDIVLEGRSTRDRPKVRGGANGNATVNGNRLSIVCIWGANDGDPPDSLKRAFLAGRRFLIDRAGMGTGITPHRDMSQTSCPGDPLTAWIRAGAPSPDGPSRPDDPPEDEDMFTDEDRAVLRNLYKVLANSNAAMAPYPHDDSRNSVRHATAMGARNARAANRQTVDIGRQVHTRENPTIGAQYGTMDRWAFNAIRPDRSQTPGARVGFLVDLDQIKEQNRAILAAVTSGGNMQAISEQIEAHHAEVMAAAAAAEDRVEHLVAQNDALADQVGGLLDGQGQIRELVDEALTGELDAMDALRALHGILGDVIAAEPLPGEDGAAGDLEDAAQ